MESKLRKYIGLKTIIKEIAVCTCDVARPAGRVWRGKRVPLWAKIVIFRYFLQNVPVTCITEILHRHDVMSFCNVIMSLVMSSPAHMWQVM